jgi:hypothetical protein
MLIIALVLAVIGLAALVTAVVTGNAVIAWICIAASVVGVVLLIVDAVRERSRKPAVPATATGTGTAAAGTPDEFDADYPDEPETYEGDEAPVDPDEHADADADTRAVPFDERHEDDDIRAGAEHPEEPTTR